MAALKLLSMVYVLAATMDKINTFRLLGFWVVGKDFLLSLHFTLLEGTGSLVPVVESLESLMLKIIYTQSSQG